MHLRLHLAQCNSIVLWDYGFADISTTSDKWREVRAEYREAGGDYTLKEYK